MATAIVDEIQVSMTPQEETRLKDARTVNPEAYDSYLRGRHFIAQRSEKNIELGLAALHEAVRLDPTLELAHVGVADAYNLMGFMSAGPARETFPRAQAAARRALELNPTSGEAFNSLAYATLWFDWNLEEAERFFRRAIDLNPRNSLTHLWFTNLLLIQKRFDEAEIEARTARIWDPHSKVAIALVGWRPYWQGDLEEAYRKLSQVIELIPDFGVAHYWLSLACALSGRDTEGVAALHRAVDSLGRTPQVLGAIGVAHALGGRVDEARQILAEMEALAAHRYVGSFFPAQVYVALGKHDAALTLLEAAFEEREHWLASLHIDPSVAALRGQPRFEALIGRVRKGG